MRDDKRSRMSLLPFLHRVSSGADLTLEEAHQAMSAILTGGVADAVIAGFLVALHIKGETAEELAGFAQAMRDKSVFVDCGSDVIDIVGTGGDNAGTFNISTVAAMVLAGAGLRVAKHGNRAISGKVGSADVWEALGIRVSMTPEEAAFSVREIGLCFLFAPNLHPAMKYAQPVRRELKMRTVFNLLGPLANPARAQVQLVGAPSAKHAQIMADALSKLGTERSFVVHGDDGLDEISTTCATKVFEIRDTRVEKHIWQPEDFGISRSEIGHLTGGDAADNAKITLEILRGAAGPKRDIVLVNAAAGLMAAGRAKTPKEGVVLAADAIDSGCALAVLDSLRKNFPAA